MDGTKALRAYSVLIDCWYVILNCVVFVVMHRYL